MNNLTKKLKIIQEVRIKEPDTRNNIKALIDDEIIPMPEAIWNDNFNQEHNKKGGMYFIDLHDMKFWSTYEGLVVAWIEYKSIRMSVLTVTVYDGDMMHGNRNGVRWMFEITVPTKDIIDVFKSKIEDVYDSHIERLFYEQEEQRKQDAMAVISKELLK